MLNKLKQWADSIKQVSNIIQDTINIKGGLYVDVFAIVMIIRLVAVLWGKQPLSASEAGMWAATIAAFSYSDTNGPKQS